MHTSSFKGIYLTGFCGLILSDQLYTFAFMVMAFGLTGEAITGSFIFAIGYGAEILVSLGLGGLLDAYPKRTIFAWTLAVKMLLFVLIFIWMSQGNLNLMLLSTAAFLVDLLGHILKLTNVVTVAKFYKGKERIQFEGWILSISSMVKISGPILAGTLHSYFVSPPYLLLFAIGFQSLAIASYCYTLLQMEAEQCIPSRRNFTQALLQTLYTLKTVGKDPNWSKLFLLHSLTVVTMAVATLLLFPLFSKTYGIPTHQIGTLMGIGTSGSMLLGILMGRFLRPNNLGVVTRYTIFLAGIATLSLNLCRGFYSAAILIFLLEASFTLFFRIESLWIQNQIAAPVMGSWWAALDAMERLCSLVGILLGGFYFDLVGGKIVYTALGGLLLAMAILWSLPAAFSGKTGDTHV